ncbi:hypothetical protein O2W18_15200, partial [Modestobacter sp. VKM Ac-2983]|nr:hypothetical protein [Modestobacter sp. VKM Ac-2983]
MRAGEAVVGELVQAYDDPGPSAEVEHHDEDEHSAGLLSWVQTAAGESVRVVTEDLPDIDSGSTVEVTVGEVVADRASEDGVEPAREVLAAELVAEPSVDESVTAPAVAPIDHVVTVVMMRPPGAPADPTTLADVQAVVGGAVADFWSQQTGGSVRLSLAGGHDWADSSAGCFEPLALWDEAAKRAGWASVHPAAGQHLLVYVPAGTPGCSYGLGTVGSGLGSGGLAYVQAARTSVIAHEFGHNVGLGHSSALQCDAAVDTGTCQVAAYNDYYDVMGTSWDQVGSLSVTQAARIGVLPAEQQRAVAAADDGGDFTLVPVSSASGTRALRLTSTQGVVSWLELRTPAGRDAWLGTSANWPRLQTGVLLRRSGNSDDTSLLLDGTPSTRDRWSGDNLVALPVGTTVEVGSGDFSVTVLGVSADAATVRVDTVLRTATAAIDAAYAGSGGVEGPLGAGTSEVVCGLAGGACRRSYENGEGWWTWATGAALVHGDVFAAWTAAGGGTSPLGYPVTGLICGMRDGGCGQVFRGGRIYSSPATGVHAVSGGMHAVWAG